MAYACTTTTMVPTPKWGHGITPVFVASENSRKTAGKIAGLPIQGINYDHNSKPRDTECRRHHADAWLRSAFAQGKGNGPKAQDVNVTNTELEVSVTNPTLDVNIINDSGDPVPVVVQSPQTTHIGRSLADHVTLRSFTLISQAGTDLRGFRRVLPDGTFDETLNDPQYGWVIPAGKILVVTDIAFNIGGTSMPVPGANLGIQLGVLAPSNGGFSTGTVYRSGAIVDVNNRAADSFHINSGVLMSADRFLVSSLAVGVPVSPEFHLYGYLVDAD